MQTKHNDFTFHNIQFTFHRNMTALVPHVRIRTLSGFSDLVRAHGGDPVPMLARYGLPASAEETNPDGTMPLTTLSGLLTLASQTLALPDFGVRLGQRQDLTILGTMALIAQHAETVGEAMLGISRNIAYSSPALQIETVRDGAHASLIMYYDFPLPAPEKRLLMEMTVSNALKMLRTVSQQNSGAGWVVHFEHPPAIAPEAYQAGLGCAVRFGQAADCVNFPGAILDIRIQSANPELRQVAEHYVRSVMHRYPLDLGRQVEDLVERQLGTGCCTLPVVAGQLAMSVHTLQRRLALQQHCFEDIVDSLRRRRAEELLPLEALPLQRVSDYLGYTSQTSFTRACRRWFGVSPRALRKRLRSATD